MPNVKLNVVCHYLSRGTTRWPTRSQRRRCCCQCRRRRCCCQCRRRRWYWWRRWWLADTFLVSMIMMMTSTTTATMLLLMMMMTSLMVSDDFVSRKRTNKFCQLSKNIGRGLGRELERGKWWLTRFDRSVRPPLHKRERKKKIIFLFRLSRPLFFTAKPQISTSIIIDA